VVRVRSIAVLVASSALVLSGCAAGGPGVAATVGQDSITIKQVDDFASALCQASGATRATVTARNTALDVLVVTAMSTQFGEAQNATYDTTRLDSELASAQSMVTTVAESYRPAFQKIVEDYVKGQLMLVDLGSKSLTAKGQQPTDSTSLTEGSTLMLASGIPVAVDPRFGQWTNGSVKIGSGSLSVPVSAAAVAADNTSAASYTADLPFFGTCG
jgi:hypothetical protein